MNYIVRNTYLLLNSTRGSMNKNLFLELNWDLIMTKIICMFKMLVLTFRKALILARQHSLWLAQATVVLPSSLVQYRVSLCPDVKSECVIVTFSPVYLSKLLQLIFTFREVVISPWDLGAWRSLLESRSPGLTALVSPEDGEEGECAGRLGGLLPSCAP